MFNVSYYKGRLKREDMGEKYYLKVLEGNYK